MNEPENTLDFPEARKKLGELLLLYAVVVTMCRLMGPSMRHISLIDWLMFRREVLAGTAFALFRRFPLYKLPYLLMPFAALFLSEQKSRAGLFFVVGMSWAGIVNHAAGWLPYLQYGAFFWGRILLPGLWGLAALILAGVFSRLSYKIFQLARFLYAGEYETKNTPVRKVADVFVLLALAFCFVSPLLNYEEIAHLFNLYERVTLLKRGSPVRFMDGSPDGKLLAVGADDGISVWDANSRQCVWSDDKMSVQRVRFSPSGRYLAAAGRGVPEGTSDLAVFEVNGFRRLPGFDWPEEDLRKEKIFHDLVFRPGEKSLLAAWHREWDWDQMGGESSEQAIAIRVQEEKEQLKKYPFRKDRELDLVCTEFDVVSGKVGHSKTIKPLNKYYDLLVHGAIYFSPDATFLLYPKWYNRNNHVERHRVYCVNTYTWTEEEIMLDRKYSMKVPVGQTVWYEWKFTRDGKIAYLLAVEVDEGGWNDRAFVLLKMDMETKRTEELRRVKVTRSFERVPWNRIALSPDEKQIALLGFGETLYDYGGVKAKAVSLRVWKSTTNKTKRFAFKHNGKGYSGARWIIWLTHKTLAIAIGDRDGFFFVDIGEEER